MDGQFIGKRVAVVGTGIAGLSAAWLLDKTQSITVFEQAPRIGGHSYTFDAPGAEGNQPVDIGFIVYNPDAYPNLVQLFDHLGVQSRETNMSLAISLDDGALEYAGTSLDHLFAQRKNIVSKRFLGMVRDVLRFYRNAPRDISKPECQGLSLGEYLVRHRYGEAFINDHLLAMAAAIWSVPRAEILNYPARAFLRFNENHGLLKVFNRPLWRTVAGGSRAYVEKLTHSFRERIKLGCAVRAVRRFPDRVEVVDASGSTETFDEVVIAAHANQALGLIADADHDERRLLGAFRYNTNLAYLHSDVQLMPKRRKVWSSWNYIGRRDRAQGEALTVTYWMNLLQHIPDSTPLFVTLNPEHAPHPDKTIHCETFTHPVMDEAAISAQRELWSLQGRRRTWFCGAYFGAGFHEDGLQAGLAVAEALGGVRRPWRVANESGRISLEPARIPLVQLGAGA